MRRSSRATFATMWAVYLALKAHPRFFSTGTAVWLSGPFRSCLVVPGNLRCGARASTIVISVLTRKAPCTPDGARRDSAMPPFGIAGPKARFAGVQMALVVLNCDWRGNCLGHACRIMPDGRPCYHRGGVSQTYPRECNEE